MSNPRITIEQLLALTTQVGEFATASGNHELALNALMSAYCAVAMAHPCCQQASANQALHVAMLLAAKAAEIPANTPIH